MRHPQPKINRGAIVTACEILGEIKTNAKLESILIEYGIDDHVRSGGSIAKTLLELTKFATQNPTFEVETDFGVIPLAHLVVEVAIKLVPWSSAKAELWDKLDRYLQLDGFALQKETMPDWLDNEVFEIKGFVISFPAFAELPTTSNEVDVLLVKHGFTVASRHLSSAKDNIAQADWEAANSQCRTFLEAITDSIADMLYPREAAQKSSGLQKRQLLSAKNFLSKDKHEFSDGDKQAYLPGLAKILHPDGAHPGISNQDDAMFRLQSVIVTASWLVKRADKIRSEISS